MVTILCEIFELSSMLNLYFIVQLRWVLQICFDKWHVMEFLNVDLSWAIDVTCQNKFTTPPHGYTYLHFVRPKLNVSPYIKFVTSWIMLHKIVAQSIVSCYLVNCEI